MVNITNASVHTPDQGMGLCPLGSNGISKFQKSILTVNRGCVVVSLLQYLQQSQMDYERLTFSLKQRWM